ncbi:acetolactate synthase large subunit, partial [Streptococcus suis]
TEALHIATTGRPGPVVIDVPKDNQERVVDFYHDPTLHLPSYHPTIEPNGLHVKKILKQLSQAQKPVIFAGGGVNYEDANKDLVAF